MIEPPQKLVKPKNSAFVKLWNRLIDWVILTRCIFGPEFVVKQTPQGLLVHLKSSLLDLADREETGGLGEILGLPPANSGITINEEGEWIDDETQLPFKSTEAETCELVEGVKTVRYRKGLFTDAYDKEV